MHTYTIYIARNPSASDSYVKRHTGNASWTELVDYLTKDAPIPSRVPFEIHHINLDVKLRCRIWIA